MLEPMPPGSPSERARVRRKPQRGAYERATIDAILDEALFCHLATVVNGAPRVVPMVHARVGDVLYVHGSNASRSLKAALAGEACVAVTLLDGLVLARSAFNHSMNYRSVVVYGRLREVTDPGESAAAQRALVDHVVPGRAAQVRPADPAELRQTAILALDLSEASAKVRTGPPVDDEADLSLEVWAGVLPLRLEAGEPEPDPRLPAHIPVPDNLRDYRRPTKG